MMHGVACNPQGHFRLPCDTSSMRSPRVDRTMKQPIAEGKPWSRPGADEDRDEDGDEGEEDTEGS